MSEKKPESTSSDHASIEKAGSDRIEVAEVMDFGGDTSLPPPPQLTPEQERKLWRKIDMKLMPILTLMYLFSFLDRGECRAEASFISSLSAKFQLATGNIGKERILFVPRLLRCSHVYQGMQSFKVSLRNWTLRVTNTTSHWYN